tara:strand:+ start:71 stop:523 length:453 start_codon:yes stop_codon:yes gene_type:complete
MIIECINCNKKFEVNSELIPNEGRSIQCGSCDHIWYFKKDSTSEVNISPEKKLFEAKNNIIKDNKETSEKISKSLEQKNKSETKKTKRRSFTISNFLSFIIVSIITFIAIILILDTFKTHLYDFFPQLETILYNLFETITDISLFIKDLI